MTFVAIDLATVPAPNIVDALDFETIFAAMLADLQARDPAFSALLESDPAYKVLEVAAYRELLLRQRVNDAAKAVMLAQSVGNDLDNIGAGFNVPRLIITPGDPNAVPPTADVMEKDADYRKRIQLAFEGLSTAGPEGGYIFHGLGADADVADIDVGYVKFHITSGAIVIDDGVYLPDPQPGQVAVTVLSKTGDGTAGPTLLAAVDAAVNDQSVRPLTDRVIVRSATIINYAINATLKFFDGPSSATILQNALNAVTQYTLDQHKLGFDITLSGIYAALHQPGVQNVTLTSPTADIIVLPHEVAYSTGITLTDGGVGE